MSTFFFSALPFPAYFLGASTHPPTHKWGEETSSILIELAEAIPNDSQRDPGLLSSGSNNFEKTRQKLSFVLWKQGRETRRRHVCLDLHARQGRRNNAIMIDSRSIFFLIERKKKLNSDVKKKRILFREKWTRTEDEVANDSHLLLLPFNKLIMGRRSVRNAAATLQVVPQIPVFFLNLSFFFEKAAALYPLIDQWCSFFRQP